MTYLWPTPAQGAADLRSMPAFHARLLRMIGLGRRLPPRPAIVAAVRILKDRGFVLPRFLSWEPLRLSCFGMAVVREIR